MQVAFGTVLAFVLVAVAFMFASIALSRALWRLGGPTRKADVTGEKLATYESGEEPAMPAWFNFNPRFVLVALVFLIFDVEIAFVFPVAVVYRRWVMDGHAARASMELFAFVAVLLLGLGYAWKKGDLDWVRSVGGARSGARPEGAKLDVAHSRAGEPRSQFPEHP